MVPMNDGSKDMLENTHASTSASKVQYKLKKPCMSKGGGDKEVEIRKILPLASSEGSVVVITSSPIKGWEWATKILKRRFTYWGKLAIRYLGSEQALIFTDDKIPKQQILDAEAIFEGRRRERVLNFVSPIKKTNVLQEERFHHSERTLSTL